MNSNRKIFSIENCAVSSFFAIAFFWSSIGWSEDFTFDKRIDGLGLIDAVSDQCGFKISEQGFEEYLSAEDLLSPEALAEMNQTSQMQSFMIGQKGGPSNMTCVQAEATARKIGIIAE